MIGTGAETMDKIKKQDERGFTLVELLTVLAIITMLLGLMVPSLNMARRFAKETKQKAQLATIGAALTVFRSDYGEYPPSNLDSVAGKDYYCGAQKLCEAMLGWDLMGFDPETQWNAVGTAYRQPGSIDRRKGRYLELATVDAFRIDGVAWSEGLFANPGPFAGDTYVLCDVFKQKRNVNAGAPVLYYRANTASKTLTAKDPEDRIYNYMDNVELIKVKEWEDDKKFGDQLSLEASFYDYIQDPKVSTEPWPDDPRAWPYRPDSYLLITAGADGRYGTRDDICNFGN